LLTCDLLHYISSEARSKIRATIKQLPAILAYVDQAMPPSESTLFFVCAKASLPLAVFTSDDYAHTVGAGNPSVVGSEASQSRAAEVTEEGRAPYGTNGDTDWNQLFQKNGNPAEGDWPECILNLTMEQVHQLSVITLRVAHTKVRGGNAPTHNLKKTGVVTAHWRREGVEVGLKSQALWRKPDVK
jgi:hypothetical protein